MTKKFKKKIVKGSLCLFMGFLFLLVVYYERNIERSPVLIADLEENNNRVYNELDKDNFFDVVSNKTGAVLLVNSKTDVRKFIDYLYDFKENYTIYVYNLKGDEMSFSFNEENDLVVNKKQSKFYDQLIEYLGAYADDQVVVQDDGTIVKTNYKVIYTPTVLFIDNGKPIYSHSFLDEEISIQDLKDIYRQGFESLKNGYNS